VDDPQCLTRRWWHGAADVAGAHRSAVLHGYSAPFLLVSLPTKPVGCEELTEGSSTGGGLRRRTCGGKVQASTFGDGGGMLQGSTYDKVGTNGCGAECRTSASGRWSLRSVACGVATKGVNLGFVSVFFEILVQLPSIYRGFRLIISCACRALSPSFPIQLGFDISTGLIEISVGDASILVVTQHGVGDDRCWAACE
jgi:hypothetical protein